MEDYVGELLLDEAVDNLATERKEHTNESVQDTDNSETPSIRKILPSIWAWRRPTRLFHSALPS